MELYIEYVNCTLSRYAIWELLDLWIASLGLGHFGIQIRSNISANVKDLARAYQLNLQENTFRALIEAYEEKEYASLEDPNYALVQNARLGDERALAYNVRQGANHFYAAGKAAIRAGHASVVYLLFPRCKEHADELYLYALKYGQKEISTYLEAYVKEEKARFFAALYRGNLEQVQALGLVKDFHVYKVLKAAACSGNVPLLQYIIAMRGPREELLRRLARVAAQHDQKEILTFLSQDLYIVHDVFLGALKAGHFRQELLCKTQTSINVMAAAVIIAVRHNKRNILERLAQATGNYIVSYGADTAFQYEAWSIIDYFLEKGISIRWTNALFIAARTGSRKLVDFCLTRVANKEAVRQAAQEAKKNGYPVLAAYLEDCSK